MHVKVTSKRVYAIVKEVLAPRLAESSFKRAKGVSLGWTKAEEGRTLSLWFQCDKYGWSEDWGSGFTCELQFTHAPQIAAVEFGGRFRYCHLLIQEELEDLRIRNNRIIESLPGYVAGKTVAVKGADGVECVIVGHRPDVAPYHPGWDRWMHYHSEEHVAGWSAYLNDHLPRLMERVKTRAS